MNLHTVILCGIVLTIIHAAHPSCMPYPNDGKSAVYDVVAENMNSFSAAFYKEASSLIDGNFICSPFSVAMVLMMASYGANGRTAAEMTKVLRSRNNNECAIRSLINHLDSFKDVDLKLASKMFVADYLKLRNKFEETAKFAFNSTIQKIDFAHSDDAVDQINAWCAEQTKSRIKDLLHMGDVDTDTTLVLVNAIYFKGSWAKEFDKLDTMPMPFYGVNGVRQVPMMNIVSQYRYGNLPEVSARFIELPYKSANVNEALSMVIILPNENDGLAKVEKNLHKISLQTLLSGVMSDVTLQMPKFKIETEIDLKSILESMGMEKMFDMRADFSGITDYPLYVSKIVQKAFIEVNEEGSEAAAVTGAALQNRWGDDDGLFFDINRPFLALIVSQDVILFSARVVDIKSYH